MIIAARKFAGIAGGFARFWKELLIVALLLVVGYQNLSDKRFVLLVPTIPYLKGELAKSEVELDIALQANANLTESIKRSNEKVQQQREMSLLLEEEFDKISSEIAGIRTTSNNRVTTIVRETAPETCTAAFEYLRDSIPELRYNSTASE